MTDDRSAHEVRRRSVLTRCTCLIVYRLAVALRELHVCRIAAAGPTLTDDRGTCCSRRRSADSSSRPRRPKTSSRERASLCPGAAVRRG
jgi:hypothetical protein